MATLTLWQARLEDLFGPEAGIDPALLPVTRGGALLRGRRGRAAGGKGKHATERCCTQVTTHVQRHLSHVRCHLFPLSTLQRSLRWRTVHHVFLHLSSTAVPDNHLASIFLMCRQQARSAGVRRNNLVAHATAVIISATCSLMFCYAGKLQLAAAWCCSFHCSKVLYSYICCTRPSRRHSTQPFFARDAGRRSFRRRSRRFSEDWRLRGVRPMAPSARSSTCRYAD
jgi:hypothetical protein